MVAQQRVRLLQKLSQKTLWIQQTTQKPKPLTHKEKSIILVGTPKQVSHHAKTPLQIPKGKTQQK